MKTKIAIGCLVQWYECDIIEEYVNSLKDALKEYEGEATYKFKPKSGEVGTPKNPGRKRPGSYTSMPIEEESLREVKDAIKKMISKNK